MRFTRRAGLALLLVSLSALSLDAQSTIRLRQWFETVVTPPNQAPVAALTLDSGFFVNDTWVVSTQGTQDIDGAIAEGTLNWGDGSMPVTISGVPAATYAHVYTVAASRTITFTVTDDGMPARSAQDTLDVVVRTPPVEGDGNAYFDFWKADPTTVRSYALRTQTEVLARTISTQGIGEIWRYLWPGAAAASCYAATCNDPHGVAPNGAKLRMPPKGWRRDRASYPAGAFLYPEHAGHGTTGNEGVSNAGRLRFPIGASAAAGWTSATIVFDFWWDAAYYTGKGALCGWKNFFLQASASAAATGGTNAFFVEHVHLCAPHPTPAAGEVAYSRFQGAGPAAGTQGVLDNDPWSPTGLGANTISSNPTHHSKWVRTWYHIELDKDGAEFTDWDTLTGVTPTGTYNMVSAWMADEDRPAERMLWKVPIRWPTGDSALSAFGILFDQSNNIVNQAEKQVLDLTTIEAGDTFTLTVPAFTNTRVSHTTSQETTAAIAFSADMRTAIEAALEALNGVDTVTLAKTTGSQTYTVTFSGAPSGMVNIGQMTIAPTGTGFTPSLSTTQQGGSLTYLGTTAVQNFYARNVLIFKNLTVTEATPFFDQPEP